MVILVVLALAAIWIIYSQYNKGRNGSASSKLKEFEVVPSTPLPERFIAQAHVSFRYCGVDIDRLSEKAMYVIADNLRQKIQIALIPIQHDIIASGGNVTFEFPQWFKKVDVRMTGMDESLEQLIVSAIPPLNSL